MPEGILQPSIIAVLRGPGQSPVAWYFRPGSAANDVTGLRSRYKGKRLVPYVKLLLASQVHSSTEDVLAAAREGLRYGDGFFFWGYNPGHSYVRQDYDHAKIEATLRAMAAERSERRD